MYIKNILLSLLLITNISVVSASSNLNSQVQTANKTTYILSYSQLIKNDIESSIRYFQNKGISQEILSKIISTEGAENGIISQYKMGKIDTNTFVDQMIEVIKIKSGKLLTKNEFQEGWNKMCHISDESVENLSRLFDMQSINNFRIIVIAKTNELQDTYIREQLVKKSIDIDKNISFIYSFKEASLDNNILYEIAKKEFNISNNELETFDIRSSPEAIEFMRKNENNLEGK